MILCEKCEKFSFPEGDEDGNFSMGCSSPSVIDIFGNFTRRYKCRYYRKISYKKLLKETKNVLHGLVYYRLFRSRRKIRWVKGRVRHLISLQKEYFEYKNYLFQILQYESID